MRVAHSVPVRPFETTLSAENTPPPPPQLTRLSGFPLPVVNNNEIKKERNNPGCRAL